MENCTQLAPSMLCDKRILVVEDNEFQRQALVAGLRNMGLGDVLAAAGGNDALDLLDESASGFDFTVCDLCMEGMDGVEFLRAAAGPKIGGVIVMSATTDDIRHTACDLALGYGVEVVGCVGKPVSLSQLRHFMLDRVECKAELAEASPGPPARVWSKADLRTALRRDQFVPFFQPKVDLLTGTPVGAEALVQWRHPDYGPIPPAQFIPLMEHDELICVLTEQMLQKTLEAMKSWQSQAPTISVALNASACLLQDLTLPNRWSAVLREHGIAPELLTVELTETAVATNGASLLETVTRLRMRGFGVSLDDFGAGYASMQQLSKMPITELKIDSSFVTDVSGNARAVAILDSIVGLAKKLRLPIVAEGIESKSDAEFVQALGCETGQGYLFARPMPQDEFVTWLCARNAPPALIG